jgi:hypothetical protein
VVSGAAAVVASGAAVVTAGAGAATTGLTDGRPKKTNVPVGLGAVIGAGAGAETKTGECAGAKN